MTGDFIKKILKKQLPILFTLAMFALALLPTPLNGYQQLVGQVMDLGHLFAFGVIALLFRYRWRAQGLWRSLLWAFILSLLAALFLELVQPWFGRQSAWSDFINSVLGALAALLGYWVWYCQSRKPLRILHGIASILLTLWIAMPVLVSLYGVWWKQSHFPQLANFDHKIEQRLWQIYGEKNGVKAHASRSSQSKTSGCCSLKIISVSGAWSGINYQAEGMDWRGYKRIAFDIDNPSDAFILRLRVDDDRTQKPEGERYEGALQIEPGMNQLSVDFSTISQAVKGKAFNFASINKVMFYIHKNDRSRLFYIDNIRLMP